MCGPQRKRCGLDHSPYRTLPCIGSSTSALSKQPSNWRNDYAGSYADNVVNGSMNCAFAAATMKTPASGPAR